MVSCVLQALDVGLFADPAELDDLMSVRAA